MEEIHEQKIENLSLTLLTGTRLGAALRADLREKLVSRRLNFIVPASLILAETSLHRGFRAGVRTLLRILGQKRVPFVWAYLERKQNPEAKAVVDEWLTLINKIKNFRYVSPKKYVGGPLANALGLQIFRTLWFYFLWKIRPIPKTPQEYLPLARKLQEDGIVVIENFLSPEDYKKLVAEWNLRTPEFSVFGRTTGAHPESWSRYQAFSGQADGQHPSAHSAEITRLFNGNRLIESVVAYASRHKIKLRPEVSLFEHRVKNSVNLGKAHQFDFEDLLHSDVPYATFKVFYYLNDIDEHNGPFTFVPGSHRVNFRRLLFECKASNLWGRGHLGSGDAATHDDLAPKLMEQMGLKERPMVAKGNTLIIANTMGFHRRSVFTDARPRRTVFMNFRLLDTLANYMG